MRANTSRERRLAFDTVVEAYDLGRPRFGGDVVGPIIAAAGLSAGARVLEIGAGTGQLTEGLVDAALAVEAIEPGANLAARLRTRLPTVPVAVTTFEAYAEQGPFEAIFSANAFHWVDPAVSYQKARALLASGRPLCLLWNFPILADHDLQARLNDELFVGRLADFRRDPRDYKAQLEQLTASGRAELAESGCFDPPSWGIVVRRLVLRRAAYLELLSSYANGADARSELERGLGRLDEKASVEVDDYVYVSIASSTV